MTQNNNPAKISWQQSRWPMAILGLVLLVFGQIQIASNKLPSTPQSQLGQWLNSELHFDIPSIDNVLYGLPILLLGGILLATAFHGFHLLPKEKQLEGRKLFGFKLLIPGWPGILCATALFGTILWSLATREYSLWMVIGWVISLVLIISIIASWDKQRGINLQPDLSRPDVLWMLGLIIIGIVVGAYHLQGLPNSLMADESNFWIAARDIVTGANKPPILGTGVHTFPILSSYLQALVLKVFGVTLWGWRFGSVLLGVVTIIPLYLLAQETLNRKIAIASSIALIASPYFLAFARLGYNNIQALFITTLALYWFCIGINRDSHLYIFLAGCASGIGVYTYFSARVAILIAITFIGVMWLARKISFRKAGFAIILLVSGMLLISGPFFVYAIKQNNGLISYKSLETAFFNTLNGELFYSDQELFAVAHPIQFNGYSLFFNPKIYLEIFIRGLTRTLLAFQKPESVTDYFISSPLTGTVGAFFYLIGLGIVLLKYRQPRSVLLLLWFIVAAFFLSAVFTQTPRYTYMVTIIPVLALLTGIGFYAVAEAASLVFGHLEKYKNLLLATIWVMVGIGGLIDYFIIMPAKYIPNSDQIMSWAVLYAHDETYYYIYSNPDEQGFLPFTASEAGQSIPFESISVDQFNPTNPAIKKGTKTVIFYSPELENKILSVIQSEWGNQYVQKSFYGANSSPILSVITNSPSVFTSDQSLIPILQESYFHLSFLILLSILFGFFLFIYLFPASWVHRVPQHLKPLVDWFHSPEPPVYAKKDQVEFLEEILIKTPEKAPIEPPEWAELVFQPEPVKRPERAHTEFKQVNLEGARDFYIKLHIPHIGIPGLHFPERSEFSLPAFRIPNSILFIFSVIMAIVAQVMVSSGNSLVGVVLYLLTAIGLISWISINPKWTSVFGNQWRISAQAEKLVLGAILFAAAFIRYYDLGFRVYGLDGDEVKWTIQSWYSTILMVSKGDFISHYIFMPVSFWIRSVFMRIFGINYVSSRIESATLSLISIIFLYLLVRRLTASKPLALFSALLYSFSFLDLNIAHQAMGETTPEVWIIGSFYFLILALQERKVWQFQLLGFSLALGMLTFESFLPSPVITLVYLTGTGLFEVIKKKTSARTWLRYLLMVFWPIILAYFLFTQGILNVRHGYDLGILMQFSGNGSNITGLFLFLFRNINHLFQTIFLHVVWTDSILYWGGSLINPILLPFVVIGFVYNLWNIRRPYFVLIPLWFLIHIAVGPLSLGAVYPRVLFTILAPLLIWGAMGLWTFLGALRALFNNQKFKVAVPIFILVLLAIILNDYHIFTSSLYDAIENQKRRELADLTVQSAGNSPIILYTFLPNQQDPLDVESSVILLSVAGKEHLGEDAVNHFKQLEFSQVLPTLWDERQLSGVDMFFDKTNYLQDQRTEALNLILNCYPGAVLSKSKKYFAVYHFDSNALSHPRCYEGPAPVAVSPQNGTTLQPGNSITFAWDTNGVLASSYSFLLDRKAKGTYWIEVEDTFQGPHWVSTSGFVNDYSGGGFLIDDWQAGQAKYTFLVPVAGPYRIWIRSYKRRVNDQHNFITIDDKKMEFASDTNTINEWVWDDLGIYDRSQGPLPMILSRTYGTDEQYSVFIDAILITSDLVDPPDQVKVWESVATTGVIASTTSEYSLSDILPPGDYRWKVRVFDGNFLVDSSGSLGVDSLLSTFSISP